MSGSGLRARRSPGWQGGEKETRQDYFIVRPPAHYNRSEHSDNSNSHGYNDGLKLGFLVFKALKTKVDNFSMVGALNKENLNMDGCLWCFGGISSFLKAVYFGHTNKKCTSSGVIYIYIYMCVCVCVCVCLCVCVCVCLHLSLSLSLSVSIVNIAGDLFLDLFIF